MRARSSGGSKDVSPAWASAFTCAGVGSPTAASAAPTGETSAAGVSAASTAVSAGASAEASSRTSAWTRPERPASGRPLFIRLQRFSQYEEKTDNRWRPLEPGLQRSPCRTDHTPIRPKADCGRASMCTPSGSSASEPHGHQRQRRAIIGEHIATGFEITVKHRKTNIFPAPWPRRAATPFRHLPVARSGCGAPDGRARRSGAWPRLEAQGGRVYCQQSIIPP